MAANVPQTLLDELVRSGRLAKADADAVAADAAKEQKDFGALLVERELMSDADLATFKSELYRIPLVDLTQTDLDPKALQEVSEDVAGFYRVAPFALSDGVLKVGILDPEDFSALEALKFIR